MEGWKCSISIDPTNVCNRRQSYRLRWKKSNECLAYRTGLALGHRLYITGNDHLATDGDTGKYSVRTIQVFHGIRAEVGPEDTWEQVMLIQNFEF